MTTNTSAKNLPASLRLVSSVSANADLVLPEQLHQLDCLIREFADNGFGVSVSTDVEKNEDFTCSVEYAITATSDQVFSFGRNWKDKPVYRTIVGTFADDDAEAALYDQGMAVDRVEQLIEGMVTALGEIYDYRARVIARHKARQLDSNTPTL